MTSATSRRSSHTPRAAMPARRRRSPPESNSERSSTAASGRPFTRGCQSHVGGSVPLSVRSPRQTPTVVPTYTSFGKAGSQAIAVTGALTPLAWLRSPVGCHVSSPSNHHSVSTSSFVGWPERAHVHRALGAALLPEAVRVAAVVGLEVDGDVGPHGGVADRALRRRGVLLVLDPLADDLRARAVPRADAAVDGRAGHARDSRSSRPSPSSQATSSLCHLQTVIASPKASWLALYEPASGSVPVGSVTHVVPMSRLNQGRLVPMSS